MDRSNIATATDGRNDNSKLVELHTVVQEAVAFAEEWPEAYRPRAFDLAVERLLGATPTAAKPQPGNTPAPITPIATGGLSVVAREIGVDPRLLARVVAINEDGKVAVLGRIGGRAKADLAVQYATVYCYVKERVLNQLDTPIEELRALAKAHGCYDGNNFTAAFRRSDLLRELGEAGAQARTYRLSTKGVEEANALLKKMVDE
jgi:hypothetical protein